jgi:hypothetical protein
MNVKVRQRLDSIPNSQKSRITGIITPDDARARTVDPAILKLNQATFIKHKRFDDNLNENKIRAAIMQDT